MNKNCSFKGLNAPIMGLLLLNIGLQVKLYFAEGCPLQKSTQNYYIYPKFCFQNVLIIMHLCIYALELL